MITNNFRLLRWSSLVLIWALLLSVSFAEAKKKPDNAKKEIWNEFVVGSVDDLPAGATKEFLQAAHFNNPYGKTIAKLTQALGPFAPEANNVFWIPTLDVPVESKHWRFLSELNELPKSILKNTIVKKDGKEFVRMFLHPFSTKEPVFTKMAKELGGFKYEFQGATTASVRSMIAWKTSDPKPADGPGKIDFPKDGEKLIWPKVSIYRTDIDGSRLNPAKKLVRARSVTELVGEIPEKTKEKVNFNFAGEWVVGVPDGTDAGYVVREVLPSFYPGVKGGVEPAFSIFSPKNLDAYTKDLKDPQEWIQKNLVKPLSRTISYMLMEEGMMGEYHTQNVNFTVNAAGKPTGEVLLHDADAFRTSIILRALNGKSVEPLQKIETPFFFMKDSIYRALGGPDASGYNLNGLLESYVTSTSDIGAPAGSVYSWCKKIVKYKKWCTPTQIREMFLNAMAEELSPYVGRQVLPKELKVNGESPGRVGLVKLVQERLDFLAKESKAMQSKPIPEIQEALFKEYKRLSGFGYTSGLTKKITPKDTNFTLTVNKDGSAFITAIGNEASGKPGLLKGIALLHTDNDPATFEFAKLVEKKAGVKIPLTLSQINEGLPTAPIMKDLGGGDRFTGALPGAREGLPPRVSDETCRKLYKQMAASQR